MEQPELPSAMDHEWREIEVHVYPTQTGARFVVFSRKNRGTKKIWHRHLCTVETPALNAQEAETFTGVLRLVSRCLEDAARRSERA
jgi:hypothetical protein